MSKDNDTSADAPGKPGAERQAEQRKDEPTTPTEKTVARPGGSEPGGSPAGGSEPGGPAAGGTAKLMPTRISGTWVAVIVAVIVLVFLLIFILQNSASVTVHYLGLSGTLPIGVALLFASVGGALLVALVGAARILQLRRFARKAGDRGKR